MSDKSMVTEKPGAPASRLLTFPDVAATCHISRRSVWRLLAAKELAAVRLGRSVRITAESVNALLARGGTR